SATPRFACRPANAGLTPGILPCALRAIAASGDVRAAPGGAVKTGALNRSAISPQSATPRFACRPANAGLTPGILPFALRAIAASGDVRAAPGGAVKTGALHRSAISPQSATPRFACRPANAGLTPGILPF